MKRRKIYRFLSLILSLILLLGILPTGTIFAQSAQEDIEIVDKPLTLCKALFAYSDSARAYFG